MKRTAAEPSVCPARYRMVCSVEKANENVCVTHCLTVCSGMTRLRGPREAVKKRKRQRRLGGKVAVDGKKGFPDRDSNPGLLGESQLS